MKSKHGILWGIALSVSIVGLVLLSWWLYLSNQPQYEMFPPVQPDPMKMYHPSTPTTSTEDFSTWKTYRNEEYGFEFKYPEFYEISHESAEIISFQNSIDCVRNETEGQGREIGVGCRNFSAYITNELRSARDGEEGGVRKVDGIPTYIVRTISDTHFEFIASIPASTKRDDQFYGLRLAGTVEQKEISQKEFDLILSTFKFTK